MPDEREIIERLRCRDRDGLIGDDVAFLPKLARPVVTVDQQISGVHFVPDLEPEVIARRLLAVNLSDLAAAGARPRYAWLALAAPRDFPIDRFLDALSEAVSRNDTRLAGGDLAASRVLTATLTLLGELAPAARELRRCSAAVGDTIWVGGRTGRSALGRELLTAGARPTGSRGVAAPHATLGELEGVAREAIEIHLAPTPQLDLGAWLAEQPRAAAIDISDGLVLDLHRLARESHVDMVLELEALGHYPEFNALATRLKLHARDLELHGGEDYVLLFALPPETRPPGEFECFAVGRAINPAAEGGSILTGANGAREELPILGWDHFARSRSPGR